MGEKMFLEKPPARPSTSLRPPGISLRPSGQPPALCSEASQKQLLLVAGAAHGSDAACRRPQILGFRSVVSSLIRFLRSQAGDGIGAVALLTCVINLPSFRLCALPFAPLLLLGTGVGMAHVASRTWCVTPMRAWRMTPSERGA